MNFVVFGQPRTGSTLLVRLLQSHPQVQCDGEILGNHRWRRGRTRYVRPLVRRFPDPYILWKASRSTAPAYGFKLLLNQVASPARVIAHLERSGWQIIHIQRRRLFDIVVSQVVAVMTGQWGEYKDGRQHDATFIMISPDRLFQQARQCIDLRQRELAALRDIPHLCVIYEDDLLDELSRNRVCSVIFEALNIEPQPVSVKRVRSWNRPYSEVITNYEELRALMQTPAGQALQQAWDRLWEDV